MFTFPLFLNENTPFHVSCREHTGSHFIKYTPAHFMNILYICVCTYLPFKGSEDCSKIFLGDFVTRKFGIKNSDHLGLGVICTGESTWKLFLQY